MAKPGGGFTSSQNTAAFGYNIQQVEKCNSLQYRMSTAYSNSTQVHQL